MLVHPTVISLLLLSQSCHCRPKYGHVYALLTQSSTLLEPKHAILGELRVSILDGERIASLLALCNVVGVDGAIFLGHIIAANGQHFGGIVGHHCRMGPPLFLAITAHFLER